MEGFDWMLLDYIICMRGLDMAEQVTNLVVLVDHLVLTHACAYPTTQPFPQENVCASNVNNAFYMYV